jgi:thiamine biosynthesis lipoprotein
MGSSVIFARQPALSGLPGLVLAGCLLATPAAGAPCPSAEELHRFSHSTMGTELVVQAYGGDRVTLSQIVAKGFVAVDALDERWSLYRPDSELARLNRQAASGAPVVLEPDLWELVQTAVEVHRMTSGAFDITVGPLVRLWGFLGGPPRWPEPDEREPCRGRVGMRNIELDGASRTLRFRHPAMELDLGAIAKGYVVDRLAERLRRAGVERFLVDFGGSSQYAAGAPPDQDGWYLYVRPTWNDRLPMKRVVARDLSLSTSGNDQRFWVHEGQLYGHVLDPRTGQPTPHRGSVSVVAPAATMSDALSTAFLVLGFEEAARIVEQHPEWGAVFYSPEDGWREVGSTHTSTSPTLPRVETPPPGERELRRLGGDTEVRSP